MILFIYLYSGLSHIHYSRLLKQLNQSICFHPSVSKSINQHGQNEEKKDSSIDFCVNLISSVLDSY